MVLLFGIIFMVSGNSLIGRYIAALFLPVLASGIYYAAHRSSEGDPVAIENLFSQFKKTHQLQQLLIVGLISMVIVSLHYLIQTYLGHEAYDPGRKMDFSMGQNLSYATLSGFLGALVSWLWSLALLFGIPLIVIKNHAAIPALKSSLNASLSSLIPLIAFYIVITILFIIAVIPFGLGLLVLVPVLFCASYNIFKTIYLEGCLDNLQGEK